ncbi:MAG: response regulator transcription factor [Oscillatoria sp. PMC 1068.18]|nr:response regulator transcription factor [Oscillatoria sp. PMC 1076.18]MEC4989918.1 response regulator transcription factor [Oscillatoria sp. PMC 1068.18]
MLSCQQPVLQVLVVDDHELTRFTLKLALASQRNIELVGLATNGQEAVDMVERYHPDVIVLDLEMPVMDGLSASNLIKKIAPSAQIIAYSSVENARGEAKTKKAQIDAFCQKDAPTETLISLINQLGQQAIALQQ